MRRATAFAWSDRGARWAFWIAFACSLVVLYVGGRHQWFIRDDWALLLTRQDLLRDSGVAKWLFQPQDGHWLTVPAILFRALAAVFGLGSYWPFLLTAIIPHLAIVLVVRHLCRRYGATEWTTTLLCTVLLVLGSGWENILFAVQVSYNLSLLGFLAQLALTDHDGPPDWRDAAGLGCGIIGLMSSGFGPFFIVGIALMLVLRARWLAAVIAAAPLAVLYAWWYLVYARDASTTVPPGGNSQIAAFTARALVATFTGVSGFAVLAGPLLLATLAVVVWRPAGRLQAAFIALATTTVLMFAGIGVQRVGLGLQLAESSRYVYMGAMLLAPMIAVAIDRIAVVSSSGLLAARLLLVASVFLNIGSLLSYGSDWARRSACDRGALQLLAAVPDRTAPIPGIYQPLAFSLDVRLEDLPYLVGEGAITPRAPTTDADEALIQAALKQPSVACPSAA